MNKDQALRLALEALENPWKAGPNGVADAITTIKQALAQPEQEKIQPDKLCIEADGCPTEKAVLQRFWREQQKTPKRKPLTDEEIWLLTSEYNDYDQHGEYFEAVFIGKPTSKQIQKHCHVNEQGAVHILNGGGRVKYEYQWYNLRKEKAAHGIKE